MVGVEFGVRFYWRGMNANFIGGEMMILRTGDLNPNRFARGYLGMESLKQAMLQHELIFRNQVRELHRLYWTQKNLMNELQQNWFDARAPSSSSRVALIKWMGSTEEKNEFYESSCSRENVASREQFKCRPAEVFSNHLINFSLHLPADEFIRGDCVDLPYSHTVTEASKSNEIVCVSEKDNVGCGLEEVIAKDIHGFASSFSCKVVIDLEASVESECHEGANEGFFGFRAPIKKVSCMLGLQPTAFSDQVSSSTVGSQMHISSMVHLDEWHDGSLKDHKPIISFAELGNSCVATLIDHSRILQEDKPLPIDINAPLEDESSHDLNDPAEDINPKSLSSVVHDGIVEHDQSKLVEASFILKPASSISVTKARCDNQADCLSRHGQNPKPFSSLESKLNLNTAAHCDNKRQDSNITSSNSTNLPQSIIRDSVNKLVSHEGSEEDTLSSQAISHDDFRRSAPSRKFPTGSNSDDSVTTQLMEKLISVEDDSTVEAAAEVLMFFSSESSAIPKDHQPNGDCDSRNNQPLHSSDSFEFMTLQLSAVQTEDHPSISKPSNPTETEKNVNGHTLRRGRGLRDFQKEILPGLSSLARHEICEDLHNIGHKLRRTASRNARKVWFVPVQGRRSRLYSGRRSN